MLCYIAILLFVLMASGVQSVIDIICPRKKTNVATLKVYEEFPVFNDPPPSKLDKLDSIIRKKEVSPYELLELR